MGRSFTGRLAAPAHVEEELEARVHLAAERGEVGRRRRSVERIERELSDAGRAGGFDFRHLLNGLIDRYLYAAGVVDTKPGRAAEVAGRHGVPAFTDARDVLDLVDAASIAVPTESHVEVARLFVERGIPVLVEKPLAASLAEAGVTAAKSASLYCVAFAGTHPAERLQLADELVETVDVDLLRRLFS